jgi:hypothetical protein
MRSSEPDILDRVLDALCDLAQVLNEVMAYGYGHKIKIGSRGDVEQRRHHLGRLFQWKQQLHHSLDVGVNFEKILPSTYYLR